MAYSQPIPKRMCDQVGCSIQAVYEVLTRDGRGCGFYCRRHTKRLLAEMDASEAETFQNRRNAAAALGSGVASWEGGSRKPLPRIGGPKSL